MAEALAERAHSSTSFVDVQFRASMRASHCGRVAVVVVDIEACLTTLHDCGSEGRVVRCRRDEFID